MGEKPRQAWYVSWSDEKRNLQYPCWSDQVNCNILPVIFNARSKALTAGHPWYVEPGWHSKCTRSRRQAALFIFFFASYYVPPTNNYEAHLINESHHVEEYLDKSNNTKIICLVGSGTDSWGLTFNRENTQPPLTNIIPPDLTALAHVYECLCPCVGRAHVIPPTAPILRRTPNVTQSYQQPPCAIVSKTPQKKLYTFFYPLSLEKHTCYMVWSIWRLFPHVSAQF